MKGQYHQIRRFNLLRDFRKYMLSNNTMRNEFINYGTSWYGYLKNPVTGKLTAYGKHCNSLIDNAERLYIEHKHKLENENGTVISIEELTRLGELKANAIPVIDQKHIRMILSRRERKARKHGGG